MPNMDGLQAARAIRQLPGGDRVKIIAVTASAFMEQREEMMQAGMDGFIRKPYRAEEIYACLAEQLGLEFIYRLEKTEATDEALTADMLAALPAELRRELRTALESLEQSQIAQALDRIGSLDRPLQKILAHLVDNFDYPAILKHL